MRSASGIKAGQSYVEIFTVDNTVAGLNSAERRFAAFGARTTAIGAGLVGGGAAVLGGLAWPLTLASNMQQASVQFEVMLGSASKAADFLQFLETFASATPYGVDTLQDASTTLLAFGQTADEVKGILGPLGDVARGNAEQFKSLALVYGQVAAAGKLNGGDLLQFINQGFNPLLEIQKETGETMGELRDRMSKGQVGVEEVRKAFLRATGDGGQFNGMMQKMSETAAGALSTALDNVKANVRELGEDLLKPSTEILVYVSELAKQYRGLFQTIAPYVPMVAAGAAASIALGTALVGTGAAASALAAGLGFAATSITAVAGAAAFAVTPIGALTVAGVAGATVITVEYIKATDAVNRIGSAFATMSDIALESGERITNAIKVGDMQAAVTEATELMKTEWKIATLVMKTEIDLFYTHTEGRFQQLGRSVIELQQQMIASTQEGYKNMGAETLAGMFESVGFGDVGKELVKKQAISSAVRLAGVAGAQNDIQRQREAERNETQAVIRDDLESEIAKVRQAHDARLDTTRQRVEDIEQMSELDKKLAKSAEKEIAAQTERDRLAAESAERWKNGPKSIDSDLANSRNILATNQSSIGSAISDGIQSFTTFNASALNRVGPEIERTNTDYLARIAAAAEDTADKLQNVGLRAN